MKYPLKVVGLYGPDYWWRWIPVRYKDYDLEVRSAKQGTLGAFPVTFCE